MTRQEIIAILRDAVIAGRPTASDFYEIGTVASSYAMRSMPEFASLSRNEKVEILNALEEAAQQGIMRKERGDFFFVNVPVGEPVEQAEVAVEPVQEVVEFIQPVLQWTASSGQQISIFVNIGGYSVEVDGKIYADCAIVPVPENQRIAARKAGIIAKLGPVGLTAERKALLQSKLSGHSNIYGR